MTPGPPHARKGFNDAPGSLPPDRIPHDVCLAPFPEMAKQVLENFDKSEMSEDALWRDHFGMAGRVRTFHGGQRIAEQWKTFSMERDPRRIATGEARVIRAVEGTSWVDVPVTFDTRQAGGLVGNVSGAISFVPNGKKGWKVWMLRTMLENFEGWGDPDDPSAITSPTEQSSQTDQDFQVVIIGAGQSGLSLAGRLGALKIRYLLIEKAESIGYSWTGKYESVKQHTLREMNNLPFERTYRDSDPDLLPGETVARGFKEYVEKYSINIWLSASVEKCVRRMEGTNRWKLHVWKGQQKYVLEASHLVLSMGAGFSVPNPPKIPNANLFEGQILNIGSYKSSHAWKGKRGIVVGCGTGGHDVAQDMLEAGLSSITMIQRGKTPVFPVEWCSAGQRILYNTNIPPTVGDRLDNTPPLKISREIMRLHFTAAAAAEKERFDALELVGFQVDRDAVLFDWVVLRGGGYYIDVGTSKRIANGEIKVKSGIPIKEFTRTGLNFEDGEELEADVVVLATGYQRDPRIQVATIVGEDVASSMQLSRGLDEEGEMQRAMTPVGVGLWLMGGAVSQARWNSRFVALQIQAELLGKAFPDCQWSNSKGADGSGMKL